MVTYTMPILSLAHILQYRSPFEGGYDNGSPYTSFNIVSPHVNIKVNALTRHQQPLELLVRV
jgi:hypothetical protein